MGTRAFFHMGVSELVDRAPLAYTGWAESEMRGFGFPIAEFGMRSSERRRGFGVPLGSARGG